VRISSASGPARNFTDRRPETESRSFWRYSRCIRTSDGSTSADSTKDRPHRVRCAVTYATIQSSQLARARWFDTLKMRATGDILSHAGRATAILLRASEFELLYCRVRSILYINITGGECIDLDYYSSYSYVLYEPENNS
jgi:ribosomal protein L34E